MAPCALIHYLGALPKCFKGGIILT